MIKFFLSASIDLVYFLQLIVKALVNIHGSVTCKERCGASVSIALQRLAGNLISEKKTVSLTDESNEFLFQDVIPGKYRIEVYSCFTLSFIFYQFVTLLRWSLKITELGCVWNAFFTPALCIFASVTT